MNFAWQKNCLNQILQVSKRKLIIFFFILNFISPKKNKNQSLVLSIFLQTHFLCLSISLSIIFRFFSIIYHDWKTKKNIHSKWCAILNSDSYNSLSQKWPLHRGIRRADSRSPPPRNSDDSSNSVSSSAMKQVWARLKFCASTTSICCFLHRIATKTLN